MIRALAFLFLASPLLSAVETPSDDEIRSKIEEEMAGDDLIDVKVSVKDHAVTLSGSVPSASAAQRAVLRATSAAEEADESAKVVSRLKVSDAPADDALARAVLAELGTYGLAGVFESVDVEARGGLVTLRGVVADGDKVRRLVERAERVPGVTRVRSALEVLAPTASDEELRLRIAGAIFDDPVFARYAAVAQPPLHIVVQRGQVVLSGVVSTDVERRRAEALTRGVPGVLGIENRLNVEK